VVDYCAVEYINATLKMKIRMIQRTKTVKGPRKGQGKKKKTTQQLFFFYEKKKDIYDLSSDDDDDDD